MVCVCVYFFELVHFGAVATTNQPQTMNKIQFHCELERVLISRMFITDCGRIWFCGYGFCPYISLQEGQCFLCSCVSVIKSISLFHGIATVHDDILHPHPYTHSPHEIALSNGVFSFKQLHTTHSSLFRQWQW